MRGWIRKRDRNDRSLNLFDSLKREMDSVFDDFYGNLKESTLFKNDFTPKVNVEEDEKNILVKAEIPGAKKEDIDVELKDGVLTIKGEKREENEKKDGKKTYMKEIVQGSFQRSFSLPENIDAEKINAEFKNGVLKLTIPKTKELANKHKIAID